MPPTSSREALLPHQQLDLNARKGRYGVVYMRAVAGQAGCGFTETSPGEDTLAIDYTLEFPEGAVRVQVKTSAQYQIDGDDDFLSFGVKDEWIAKWARTKLPIYFVIVVVPNDSGSWLNHDITGTQMVRTAAYWVRLQPGQFATTKTIKIPRSQRVTSETLPQWHLDFCALFTPSTETEEAA
ncbi:DUF4365 domain-containing protein [Microbacterium stercoris]|uniref:DUF4365 domain-containing protein n=1 Tax=Microbacterium stercoris TaxID=2820289 RepID=A0A939QJ59_9MICO|nr:DUF4365 domain-containing protein [Microbacterium stercoris]MBO3663877.1 DUF4365 domain-containing protein [Microbacterium stercoris]